MRFIQTFFIAFVVIAIGALPSLKEASAQSQGRLSLIRDTEIENTIRVFANPIFKVAGLDAAAVRIHLVKDDTLNAFVAKGQRIFFNTGLLMRAENAGQLIGVLAHESGHITGGHLARFGDGINTARNTAIAGLLLGIPLALATGQGEALIAAQALSNQVATRNLLSYTRSMEQSADQAAVNFLDDAGISSQGLLEFMQILDRNRKLYSASQNPYVTTHPLTSARIDFVHNHLENSALSKKELPPEFNALFDRMRAKLVGYIKPLDVVLRDYPADDQTVPALYARSIAYMRDNQIDRSIELADQLLIAKPNDPFFFELKGDIYKHAGNLEAAIPWYNKALEILPWAALIRYNIALALMQEAAPEKDETALGHLRTALNYEPNMVGAWRLATKLYARRGNDGLAALSQAEAAIRSGEQQQALKLAEKAQSFLTENSASWIRAQDIIFQVRQPEAPEE